ncbi:hypothetical protein FQV39_03145 [Bosea sp. F3-2]|uniref:hypothetical protein n=1 Tax=Bosea sp. F3-2 TaxID=2599640 RepID=UPI0011F03F83|nr:hypothetical protein [Bosea sp. F3-2]QEL21685.1 hypothetical protein FQV39_03145 [Bosea sp. F3-2]
MLSPRYRLWPEIPVFPPRTLFQPWLLAAALLCDPAAAQESERRWHASGYVSRWMNTDLLDVPTRAFTGNLDFSDTNFAGVGLSRVIVPSFTIPLPFTDIAFHGNRLELEGQILRHFGGQSHWEGTLAFLLRTPQIPLAGGVSVNFAVGEGLSYASERPRFEGAIDVRPTRLLNYLAFEAEFAHESLKGVSFVARLHHRSGVFGLIAPQKSGSNFIGAGIRVDLR